MYIIHLRSWGNTVWTVVRYRKRELVFDGLKIPFAYFQKNNRHQLENVPTTSSGGWRWPKFESSGSKLSGEFEYWLDSGYLEYRTALANPNYLLARPARLGSIRPGYPGSRIIGLQAGEQCHVPLGSRTAQRFAPLCARCSSNLEDLKLLHAYVLCCSTKQTHFLHYDFWAEG